MAAHVTALRSVLDDGVTDGAVVTVGLRLGSTGSPFAYARAGACDTPPSLLAQPCDRRRVRGHVSAERSQMGAGGVVHSFDGDVAELKELLGLGLNGCSQDLDVAARARAAGQAASGDQRAVVWDQKKAC
jgi:hypothetical protein